MEGKMLRTILMFFADYWYLSVIFFLIMVLLSIMEFGSQFLSGFVRTLAGDRRSGPTPKNRIMKAFTWFSGILVVVSILSALILFIARYL